ncbi:hypothetical protein [Vermiculatibacterium agrestimuris]|uniref:hypothetical protein n=1 Tax=Vermiculatibacterium agrestimuris TaxID=2941519 RepID=UPI0020422FE8|nr:hypothetical protein [Vermiculatibacterium agrestimuris]
MVESIVKTAVLLSGREESEELTLLCGHAAEALAGQLRGGLTPEACGAAFVLAGAWLALAELETAGEGDVTSFTAGDVTIRKREGENRGEALRMQAMQVMKPYLRDEGFVFRGVRG